ncbi:LexA regulated protein [Thalassotalea eurytherma]|uniref:LexA family transcriptional regulator n=1 Tax=Thalassotalea eurytherma TaxID=1144278 RepID=A0ABQ6H5T7_9GAMM|nr:LexA regulated protein [Thalassotalea eurytherma]GLX83518.1 LexA family transcriptional regulator [Thalassotalea eurytherma]
MAKEVSDVTTIDLFSEEKRPGRPRTNPHSRSVQVKINKRNQVKRDKKRGLKRVEFKMHQSLFEKLDAMAQTQNVSRGELIESILADVLESDEC